MVIVKDTNQIAPGDEPTLFARSYWPDHISPKTLEHMCLSLLEEQGDKQTLVHYRVCVYIDRKSVV